MKLGIIVSNYNCVDLIDDFFKSWIDFMKLYSSRSPHEVIFSIIDTRFKGNGDNDQNVSDSSDDGSCEKLRVYNNKGIIKYYVEYGEPIMEHEARTIALKPLLEDNCDYILSTAFDEKFEIQDIDNILSFIGRNPLITWFSINYKNYVFDKNHYVLGFTPPRIFKVKSSNYELDKWFWDDDLQYKGAITRDIISYQNLSSKMIPNVLVKHYTWLDCERSRLKVIYQSKHFLQNGQDSCCSFRWNYQTNHLEFNDLYYQKLGLSKPEVFHEI